MKMPTIHRGAVTPRIQRLTLHGNWLMSSPRGRSGPGNGRSESLSGLGALLLARFNVIPLAGEDATLRVPIYLIQTEVVPFTVIHVDSPSHSPVVPRSVHDASVVLCCTLRPDAEA